jgi:hypothetical protein
VKSLLLIEAVLRSSKPNSARLNVFNTITALNRCVPRFPWCVQHRDEQSEWCATFILDWQAGEAVLLGNLGMVCRQKLPADYYKEWLRVPYAAVVCFTLGAYWAHPLMQQAAYYLNW